jgi:uncharacterized protein YggU (UPF0235/DUF167 family)
LARFEVYVSPRSSRPGPDGRHGGVPRLRLSAPASEGRANAEAERALSDLIGVKVRLVGGGRSRTKTFEADIGREPLSDRLGAVFGEP